MTQPTPADLRTRIREFIRENYADGEDIRDDTELVRSGIIESYGVVDLLLFVESEFGLTFPDEMLTPETFRTVADIARNVDRLREAKRDAG